jgi:YtcA family
MPSAMRVGPIRACRKKRVPSGARAKAKACDRLLAALSTAALAGCSAAPSHSILGSYFPSWMICALVGLLATVIIRQIFVSVGIDRTLPAPLLVYLALAVAGAFATWLIWLDGA